MFIVRRKGSRHLEHRQIVFVEQGAHRLACLRIRHRQMVRRSIDVDPDVVANSLKQRLRTRRTKHALHVEIDVPLDRSASPAQARVVDEDDHEGLLLAGMRDPSTRARKRLVPEEIEETRFHVGLDEPDIEEEFSHELPEDASCLLGTI